MTRTLPPRPNLDHLKREAKRLLKAARSGEADALAMLRRSTGAATATNAEVASTMRLADAQHALALDYGCSSWKQLKAHVESRTPFLRLFRPVLRVGSYRQAVEHYVDWLGFRLEWDWSEAPGQPVIASLCRDDAAFMINEHPDTPGPTELHLEVKNFDALIEEWNARRPGSAEPRVAPPYEFPGLPIRDPWGNVIVFEGKDELVEEKRRNAVRPKMRRYVQAQLDAGEPFPSPEEVRDAVGPPLGTAIEVLNEFAGYGEAFAARRKANRED